MKIVVYLYLFISTTSTNFSISRQIELLIAEEIRESEGFVVFIF
jgi:hypothetical protein